MDAKQNIDISCPAHLRMKEQWELIDALLGSTLRIRRDAVKWLPKEERESNIAYRVRLERSILYGALRDTIRRLRSKPFSKPVKLEGSKPEQIESFIEDSDGAGTDLTQFAGAMFDDAVAHGLTHCLVDFPRVAEKPDETRDEIATRVRSMRERELGIRARFVHVKACDLVYWASERDSSGRLVLSEIRIKECASEDDGSGTQVEREHVRVLTPRDWTLYVKRESKWVVSDSGTHTFGRIPLVTVYFQRTGFMCAEPPLCELAWLNLAHYQSDSDQRNILRFARFGILFMKGVTAEEKKTEITIGPSKLIRSSSPDADLKVVEHSGKSIEAGRLDLQDLEARMEMLGLQPLMSRTGDATATGQAIDESKTQCDVQAWVRSLERGLTQAFGMAAEWMAVALPADFKVDIFSEFGLAMRAAEDIRNLIAARQGGLISHETFLLEVRRRALISETVDPKEEIQRIEDEGPGVDGLVGIAALAADAAKEPDEDPSDPEEDERSAA